MSRLCPTQECRGPATASQREGDPTNARFVPATGFPSSDSAPPAPLPDRFNLSLAQRGSLWAQDDEKDVETTGGSRWSRPPPTHIPLPGATAWTPRDWPGQRARRRMCQESGGGRVVGGEQVQGREGKPVGPVHLASDCGVLVSGQKHTMVHPCRLRQKCNSVNPREWGFWRRRQAPSPSSGS